MISKEHFTKILYICCHIVAEVVIWRVFIDFIVKNIIDSYLSQQILFRISYFSLLIV